MQDAIESVITGLFDFAENELQRLSQSQLDAEYWHFRWDETASLEANIYDFHDMLQLYGSFCRRWEEKHNGSVCVVERVRDTYLMPKIREFAQKLTPPPNRM